MSTTPATREERRVRHQARDVAAVMGFSAGTSIAVAALLLLAGGILGGGR